MAGARAAGTSPTASTGVDIRFGFETHMVYLHDTVEATRRLVTRIGRPSIGVNLDYGNIVDFPDHPVDRGVPRNR